MSEMVERVARAMALRQRGGDFWEVISDGKSGWGEDGLFKEDYRELARAAIKAMREPTEAMEWAVEDWRMRADGAGYVWRQMIDAAMPK